jgi:hypothetical protein
MRRWISIALGATLAAGAMWTVAEWETPWRRVPTRMWWS